MSGSPSQTGVRFLDKLRAECSAALEHPDLYRRSGFAWGDQIRQLPAWQRIERQASESTADTLRGVLQNYVIFKALLDDPNTKRIIFDARQAVLFDDLNAPPDENMRSILRFPFDTFYLELSEPILLGEAEPEIRDGGLIEHHDYARAFLIWGKGITAESLATADEFDFEIPTELTEEDGKAVDLSVKCASLFLTDEEGNLVDRSWKFDLKTGLAFVRPQDCLGSADPSRFPDTRFPESLAGPGYYFPAGYELADGGGDRYVGWWERVCLEYTALLCWIVAYMMAKTVHIVEEPYSRQVRRWHERKKRPLPPAWHVVSLDPKITAGGPQTETGEGAAHRYRYDVIGHLRFGRHKLAGGEYRETIEWVAPHQRGLRHSLYIPKTYKVDRRRAAVGAFRRYVEKEKSG